MVDNYRESGGSGKSVQEMTFEEAMVALEEVVAQLESGTVMLDDAVGAYERGVALVNRCRGHLAQAKERIDKVRLQGDKVVAIEPFEEERPKESSRD
ncbi:MAG: exodeoxyribonuclease VII small subunit [Alphaproteobacteria bacterium GM202ARS2]|nr:exodeoxyribonuclease VII small subunit [Alphaproteobacteria bacterium GM202ARS2]